MEFSEEDEVFFGKVLGIRALISYEGSFNIRISPELQKQIAFYATSHQVSINSLVERALQNFVMMQM